MAFTLSFLWWRPVVIFKGIKKGPLSLLLTAVASKNRNKLKNNYTYFVYFKQKQIIIVSANMKYIFDFDKNNVAGFPDGSTIDTDGNLWVAVFDGSCVINIDPRTGIVLRKIPIPALQVTSATFGGPNYDILFVTTASLNIQGPQHPPCGATFMVTGLGVKGHPNVNYRL